MLNKKHILIAGALLCTGNCLFHSASATESHLRYQNAPTRDELQQELNELLRSLDYPNTLTRSKEELEKWFNSLNDKEFDEFMLSLNDKELEKFLLLLDENYLNTSIQMSDLQKQRRIDELFRSLEEKDRASRLNTLAQRNREERNKKLKTFLYFLDMEVQALHEKLYPGKSIRENFVITDREFDRKLFIMHYGINLLNDGYKLEFAVEVCKAMMFLYEEGMEDLLLEDIGSVSDVVWAPEYISMRKRVTDKLKEIMKKYGADYEHIRKWGFAQQGSKWGFIQPGSSWSDASCAVKYYLLEQRKNMSFDFSNIYFFNNFSQEETRKRSEKFFSDSKIKPDAFFKSIILCKALAAIALNKLELPGIINHETNTCTIQRGMRRETLLKNPGYGAIAEGEIFRGLIKHGIADSVALGAPPRGFTKPFFCDVIEMELPFSRFHFVYFLSPEFCEDDAPKDKLISLKADFPSQHECLCDMSKIPLKLKRKAQF